eukprot:176556_1
MVLKILHQKFVIKKNVNKLKKVCKRYRDRINEFDHHGYTPLHLAVLLKWDKGCDLLLSSYANPTKSSLSGWTSIQEAISTKQTKILNKLIKSMIDNFSEYSKQNVSKIYNRL